MRRLGVLLLVAFALAPGVASAHPEPNDVDGDGVRNEFDNCVNTRNADQTNTDAADPQGDAAGDRCDTDADADGKPNPLPYLDGDGDPQWDNCPLLKNPGQEPSINPRYGKACYVDSDGDGEPDPLDNCPGVVNPDQDDYDFDRTGDVCDLDDDDDGDFDATDNCQFVYNWEQTDADGDGIGAACDANDVPAAGPGPPPPSSSPPPDTAAPAVRLALPRTLRLRELGRSIAVEVRCSERCTVRAELLVKRRKVASGTAALGGRGTTYVFMRRLRRLAPARATLRLTATDAAGNVSRATHRISLRR